jgi:hypothetical protein
VQSDFACSKGVCSLPEDAAAAIEGGQREAASDGASTTDAFAEGASPGDTSPGDDAAGQDDSN